MNSFAHYSFGAVYQWMVENIGGIRTDGPAYKQILIAPQIDAGLTWAQGRLPQHPRADRKPTGSATAAACSWT